MTLVAWSISSFCFRHSSPFRVSIRSRCHRIASEQTDGSWRRWRTNRSFDDYRLSVQGCLEWIVDDLAEQILASWINSWEICMAKSAKVLATLLPICLGLITALLEREKRCRCLDRLERRFGELACPLDVTTRGDRSFSSTVAESASVSRQCRSISDESRDGCTGTLHGVRLIFTILA